MSKTVLDGGGIHSGNSGELRILDTEANDSGCPVPANGLVLPSKLPATNTD